MFAVDISFFGAFLGGVLSFLSPCVLPLVPPYLCYLAGTSLEAVAEGDGPGAALTRRMVLTALLFVAGFTTVFVALGATASALSQLLTDNSGLFSTVAGIVIILFGLHFIGVFRIALLYREARVQVAGKPASLIAAYPMGLAFAFGWTPCVGPVLAAVLAVAADQNSVASGTALLAVYSLGLGLPFMAVALATRPFMDFMRRFRTHMRKVELGTGLLLVATGVLFVTGSFQDLGFWLLEAFPTLGTFG